MCAHGCHVGGSRTAGCVQPKSGPMLASRAWRHSGRSGWVPRLATLLVVIVLIGCPQVEQPMVIGAHLGWIGYQPLFLADDHGALSALNVRSAPMLTLPTAQQALRDGRVHALFGTLDEAIRLLADGFPVRIVLVATDSSDGADGIVAGPHIRTVADLRDRSIGMIGFGVGGFILSRALELNGLTADAIRIVPLSVDRQIAAFRAGTVDAIVTFEPLMQQARTAGGHVIFDSRQMPGELLDVLMVHADLSEERITRLRLVLDIWFDRVGSLMERDRTDLAAIAERVGREVADVPDLLRKIRFLQRREVDYLLNGRRPRLVAVADRMQRAMIQDGLLKGPVAVEEMVDAELIASLYGDRTRRVGRALAAAHTRSFF